MEFIDFIKSELLKKYGLNNNVNICVLPRNKHNLTINKSPMPKSQLSAYKIILNELEYTITAYDNTMNANEKEKINKLKLYLFDLPEDNIGKEYINNITGLFGLLEEIIKENKEISIEFKSDKIQFSSNLDKITSTKTKINIKPNKLYFKHKFKLLRFNSEKIVYLLRLLRSLLNIMIICFNDLFVENTELNERKFKLTNIVLLNEELKTIEEEYSNLITINESYTKILKTLQLTNCDDDEINKMGKDKLDILIVYDLIKGLLYKNLSFVFDEINDPKENAVFSDYDTYGQLLCYTEVEKEIIKTLFIDGSYILKHDKENQTVLNKLIDSPKEPYRYKMDFKYIEFKEIVYFLSLVLYKDSKYQQIFYNINTRFFSYFLESMKFVQAVEGLLNKYN